MGKHFDQPTVVTYICFDVMGKCFMDWEHITSPPLFTLGTSNLRGEAGSTIRPFTNAAKLRNSVLPASRIYVFRMIFTITTDFFSDRALLCLIGNEWVFCEVELSFYTGPSNYNINIAQMVVQ
jgi:hypothetical protein